MGGRTLNVDRDIDTIKLDFFDIEKQSVDDVLAKRFGAIPAGFDKDKKPIRAKDKSGNVVHMRSSSAIDTNTETAD
ncbi:hypothetical protein KA478_03970 [Patescibacteria group bacterium]|nr:hypothetical protein [Patescibacteria group bacterium]